MQADERRKVKRKLLSRLHGVTAYDHEGVAITTADGERKQCSPLSTSWTIGYANSSKNRHSSNSNSRPSGGTHKMERVYVSKRPYTTDMLRLDPNTGDPRVFLYKSGHKNAVQCQLEVALCEIVRLLDYELVSRSWVVDDDSDRAVGILIDPIDGFVSERDDERPLSADEFVENGGVEMLFISYLLREDDLHKGNFGRDAERRVRRIDCDMLLWDVMYIFKGVRDPTGVLVTPPHKSFVITERDLRSFPKLSDASPFYWPTNGFYRFSTSPGKDKFFDLASADDERVRERMFACAVKFLCIPEETFTSVLATHIRAPESMSSPSGGIRNVIEYVSAHLVSIQEELRRVLTHMYEFIRYVGTRGDDIEQWLAAQYDGYRGQAGTQRTFYDREQVLNQWLWLRNDTMRNANVLTVRSASLSSLQLPSQQASSRWSSVFKLPKLSSSFGSRNQDDSARIDLQRNQVRVVSSETPHTRDSRMAVSMSADAVLERVAPQHNISLCTAGAGRRSTSPITVPPKKEPSSFDQHLEPIVGPIRTFFDSKFGDSVIFDDYNG